MTISTKYSLNLLNTNLKLWRSASFRRRGWFFVLLGSSLCLRLSRLLLPRRFVVLHTNRLLFLYANLFVLSWWWLFATLFFRWLIFGCLLLHEIWINKDFGAIAQVVSRSLDGFSWLWIVGQSRRVWLGLGFDNNWLRCLWTWLRFLWLRRGSVPLQCNRPFWIDIPQIKV